MRALVDRLARSIWTTLAAVLILGAIAVAIGRAFELTLTGSIGLYFVVWWIVLFAVLPIGMRTQADEGIVTDGTEPGAPAAPALRERAIWTSAVSTVLFAALAALFPIAGL